MITLLAKWIVILFGVFFIFVGFLMLFVPNKARKILEKAGSTNLINYGEITIRMIPAAALVLSSDISKFPAFFKIFGWFMLITSLILYAVPRRFHHNYALKSAEILKPVYWQLISPFSIFFGIMLIYSVI
ncbi:MAG: hypothetical protein U9N04_04450 [Patescibacteria group bacterium]|nr:hypothetical protein [Patescibacteria group bacterium]